MAVGVCVAMAEMLDDVESASVDAVTISWVVLLLIERLEDVVVGEAEVD